MTRKKESSNLINCETLKKRTSLKNVWMLLAVMVFNQALMAQELKLGDPAPSLTPYEWIKGAPVTKFEKGKVYVVEMGATWCKPCAAAIPKLTQLAKEYKGRVEVVGLFVQEMNGEPLDTPNPKYVENVKRYVDKLGKKIDYHVGVDDPQKTLERIWIDGYVAVSGVPQTFLIDQQGRLAAHFEGLDEVQLKKAIDALLAGTYSIEKAIEKKKQEDAVTIKYDYAKDLYVDGNGGDGSEFIFRSILSKWPVEIEGRSNANNPWPLKQIRPWLIEFEEIWSDDDQRDEVNRYRQLQGKVQSTGSSLDMLYYAAYTDTLSNSVDRRVIAYGLKYISDSLSFAKKSYHTHWYKPVLEVSDRTPFETSFKSPENKWTYSLNVPDKKIANGVYLQKLMRQDLERYFGYNVSLETREMPVYYLRMRSGTKKLTSKSQNKNDYKSQTLEQNGIKLYSYTSADIRDFISLLAWELNAKYPYSSYSNAIEERFIDDTNIDYLIDYDITEEELYLIKREKSLKTAKEWLARHGLYLEKGTKPMKVVVIRDPKDGILGPALRKHQNIQ